MNGNIYRTNIKALRKNYIFQLILSVVAIIFNFILLNEIYWLNSLLYYIYISICIFGILYFLIPIIPFIFILLKKLTLKRLKIFKVISIIFCSFVIITGLAFIIVLMINTLEFVQFCHECPFNLQDSYIDNIYNDYINNNLNEKVLKDQCTNRRCMFNNDILESQYNYEYICNYNPTEEFGKIRNEINTNETINNVECNKIQKNINNYNFENRIIYKFFEMCNSFEEFYICQRIDEPNYYAIEDEFKCPKKTYMTYLILFCMISVLLNLILSFFPWKLEYNKYKNILDNIRPHNNRIESNSLNSTRNASKIKKEEVDRSFKKEPTEIIIVYNNTEENIINENENNNTSYDNAQINNKKNSEINNPIKFNTIIINNNIRNNKIKNNNNLINKDNMEKEDTNMKLLKINNNQSKKKENEKNNKIKNKDNISNKSSTFSPTSERHILEYSKDSKNIN